jgi:hypothetical protein
MFVTEAWTEGLVCPECHSNDTHPATIFEGAVEYSLAARTMGPTIEDLRLARVIRWLRLAEPVLLQKLLAEQVRTAEGKGNAPPLGDLLLREEALDSRQLSSILRGIRVKEPPTSWQRFGEYAFRAGLLTREQLEQCSAIQLDLIKRGMEFPFIGHVMVEMGFCKEGQVQALLTSQKKKRQEGFLWEMERELQQETQPGTQQEEQQLAEQPVDRELRKNLLFAGAAVLLVSLTVLGSRPAPVDPDTRFGAACLHCGLHEAEFSPNPTRAPCPKCSEDLTPCVVCVACRALVPMTRDGKKRCPACGAASFARWRAGMQIGKLQSELSK